MRTRRIGLALGVPLALTLCLASSLVLTMGQSVRMSQHARDLLAAAQERGDTAVTLLVASATSRTGDVAAAFAALGGDVRYEDDTLGYVRVIVPIDQVAAATRIDGIDAIDVDEVIPLPDPTPETIDQATAVPAPGPDTPPANPYLPAQDIGAPQFVASNPTFDGRGVTIGIVDTGVDMLTPELQSARLLDGTPAPKFVDWVTFTDPITDRDPTWINMKDQVQVSGATFVYNGVTYTAPAPGTYRVGVFQESALGIYSEYGPSSAYGGKCATGADVNRNGVCNETFAVLWRTSDNLVWVDANANASFADETPMTDYKVRHDVGLFGADNAATPVRESVPFVVQTSGRDKFVNIGIVSGSHATHVAGIAAGKGFFGGAYNGVAPEARIVSVRACLFSGGCTAHAMTEGMIYAARQSNVDVINMSIGGLPALNDGNNARAILYNRLIDQTKAQMFISAGNNGPGLNTVADPSVATDVMSVGAYVSKQTWWSNYGASVLKDDGLFVFSSRGPREDGGFKPDIVTPGCAVSTLPAWQLGRPVAGTYPLPPGYGMGAGTSMAAPEATGGAALLVSAARQMGVQYKPAQLRDAIRSSARYLPAYGAYEQGNGLFQVAAAWELLRKNIKIEDIESVADVNTVLAGQLETPWHGRGIHEREGWTAGASATRTITFVRTSGGSQPIAYDIEWVGNDGTFSSAASISLRRDTPAALQVAIHPVTSGAHSAVLNLKAPGESLVAYQVMNTIVAAEPISAANGYEAAIQGSADRGDKASFFFSIPPGTSQLAFQVLNINGTVRMSAVQPSGLPYGSIGYVSGGTITGPIVNPAPGVWEVMVDAYQTSAIAPATFTVKTSLFGATIQPSSWTIEGAQVGTPYSQAFTFTNTGAAFTGRALGAPLASTAVSRQTIDTATATQWFDITVPAGASSVSARIGNAAAAGADLDLYLYDCTGSNCVLKAGSARNATSEESVTYNSPAVGLWRARVVVWSIPSGSTAYDFLEQVAHPMWGNVTLIDAYASHPVGSSWSATATYTPSMAPPPGRFLMGTIRVVSTSAVLASADVVVKF